MLDNYDFIYKQIETLESGKFLQVGSAFFRHLNRQKENYHERAEKLRKHREEVEARKKVRQEERDERRKKKEEEQAKKRIIREKQLAIRMAKKREAEKYPMEDTALMEEMRANGQDVPPVPMPAMYPTIPAAALGDIIMAWQMINTFSDTIQITSPITLEMMCQAFVFNHGPVVMVTEIFCSMLRGILNEKKFIETELDKEMSKYGRTLYAYGISDIPLGDILNSVSWPEVLRQMIGKDIGHDTNIGQWEALVGCEEVIHIMYMQNKSSPFNRPVDTSNQTDYLDIVKEPMDIGLIRGIHWAIEGWIL